MPAMPPFSQLDNVLNLLYRVDQAVDLKWLHQLACIRLDLPARMHGVPGGVAGHEPQPAALAAWDAASQLDAAAMVTFYVVTRLLWYALDTRTSDSARGVVLIKTLHKSYVQIDFETGFQQIDDTGKPVFFEVDYRYVYVRLYAGGGNADKRGTKLTALYADQGMGRGGNGGWVAAALDNELITKNDILDAWHTGTDAYQKFIEHCQELVLTEGQAAPDHGEVT